MTRAVRALAIGMAIVAAGCVGSPSRSAPIGAARSITFAALWPEQTLGAALRVQSEVRADASSLGWRLDPSATAQRFAAQVLGWGGSQVVSEETWALASGTPIARVWLCELAGCPPSGAAFDEEVVLKRLTGPNEDAVWSVTDVTSGRILLDDGPRIRIRDPRVLQGRRLGASTKDLPDGARVLAGSAAYGPCGTGIEVSDATVRFSTIRFEVGRTLGTGCSKGNRPSGSTPGFVFAMPRERGMNTDPATLFIESRPAASRPIPDLTAIAVRFLPRAAVPGPIPRWRSRDPATLPMCSPAELHLGPISAGQALSAYAVGISVEISRLRVAACHARMDLAVRLRDRTGARIPVAGRHRIVVDGYLPGETPGRRSLVAGWMLSDWCGRTVDGPVEVDISGAGLRLTARSDQLAMWCPPERGPSSGPKLQPLRG